MSTEWLLIIVFIVLLAGQLLPLSYGQRMALFLALIVYAAIVLIGGGMSYLMNQFD